MSHSRVVHRQFDRIRSFLADYLPVMRSGGMKQRSGVVQNIIAAVLVISTAISCVATYAALNEMPPFGDDPDTVLWLLTLDFILLMALMTLLARRVVGLWSGRKRGLAGSHLHVRLVYIFSVMAAVPAIIMTVFSVFFFNYGIQTWFGERVQTAVLESQEVAEAYLEEHKQVIRADTLAMANDIDRQLGMFLTNKESFNRVLETQSFLRNLAEVVIFDATGRVIASSGLTFTLEFEEIPAYALNQADDGDVVLMTGANEDRVRALIRLDNFMGAYLFVGRMVDPTVLSHLAATQKASRDYQSLEKRSSQLQILAALIFTIIGLLLLFVAIWLGFVLARQLVAPITDLIEAAERVREGDFEATIEERGKVEEFDFLALAFNRMTAQISEQQNALIDANAELDERRRFTETVLAGATSGIVGVDKNGKITLVNASASKLLNIAQERLVGLKIRTVSMETDRLLKQAHEKPSKVTQAEITIDRSDIGTRLFLVSVAIEMIDGKDGREQDIGAIITFDDITDLQSAQRKAAWADVARRIAHEIKNPLTPIQLSAERLKRKYLKDIKDDAATFEQCTDTIIRNVEDIGHMVNEFSSFARMPLPSMQRIALEGVLESSVNLYKNAHSDVKLSIINGLDDETFINADEKQLRQALNNLIQNAIDSVLSADQKKQGWVEVHLLGAADEQVAIVVRDNGIGLPDEASEDQLIEPYVTHKPKGTGLGLAIVKKIMEDHNGELLMSLPDEIKTLKKWNKKASAAVCLTLPKA